MCCALFVVPQLTGVCPGAQLSPSAATQTIDWPSSLCEPFEGFDEISVIVVERPRALPGGGVNPGGRHTVEATGSSLLSAGLVCRLPAPAEQLATPAVSYPAALFLSEDGSLPSSEAENGLFANGKSSFEFVSFPSLMSQKPFVVTHPVQAAPDAGACQRSVTVMVLPEGS